jgi:hypothetical protein
MSDEQWRRVSDRAIQTAIAHAPGALKKPPEGDHAQETAQAKVSDR